MQYQYPKLANTHGSVHSTVIDFRILILVFIRIRNEKTHLDPAGSRKFAILISLYLSVPVCTIVHPYWYPLYLCTYYYTPWHLEYRMRKKGLVSWPYLHPYWYPHITTVPITIPLGSWNTDEVGRAGISWLYLHPILISPYTRTYLLLHPLAPGIQDEVGRAGIMALVIEECHHYPWAPRQSVRPRAACLPIHLLVSINLSVCPLS